MKKRPQTSTKQNVTYFWESSDGAQQLGAVADGGGSVVQGGGELGRLAEVVLLVIGRLVINTWRMKRKKWRGINLVDF